MSGRRWLKFWPQDWQRDPALRICCVAARGLWMDMICIAHEGTPYGHVTISGAPATMRQLGRITGMTEKEAQKLVHELENAGVFSRTASGVIYSRRMVRDNEASEAGRVAVKTRWDNDKETAATPKSSPNRGGNTPYSEAEAEAEAEAEKKPPNPQGGIVDDPSFAAFWASYPRKDAKGDARKAWAKAIKTTLPETITKGVQAYHFDPRPKFIPLPATWLNGERWAHDGALPDAPDPWDWVKGLNGADTSPIIDMEPDDELPFNATH